MELAERVLGLVGDRAEAEVRVVGGTSALTRFANSFIHQNVAEEGISVALRVARDGRVLSSNTTNTEPAALTGFVDGVLEAAALQPVDEGWPGLTPPSSATGEDHFDAATAQADPADRARQVADFVAADPELRAAGYCETEGHEVAFANSLGHRVAGRYSSATIDGIHQTDSSAGSGHSASARLADLSGTEVGSLAAQRARDSADAYDVKPGEYEVVFAPEVVASIVIFLAGYGLQAKAHAEGQSFAELGAQQFDPAFSLFDDATDPRAIGLWFDSEGTVRSRTALIEAGVTTGLAHDRRTAKKAETASTGHAYPGSEVWGPLADSLFVSNGTEEVEALIRDVERGLYVSTFNYCRVLEPKSLLVTGLTRNGTFMIENGAITGAVTNLRFTQSFMAGLGPGAILGVGNDARHADSEFGANMVHAPSLRLSSWAFTGGAAG
jgi:predicted Zn-dependent protease